MSNEGISDETNGAGKTIVANSNGSKPEPAKFSWT
jgi:hypothetical protein